MTLDDVIEALQRTAKMNEQHHQLQQHNPSQAPHTAEQPPQQYLPQQNPPQIHSENPCKKSEKGSQKLPARKELPKGGFYSREFTEGFVISSNRWTKFFFLIIKS